MNKCGLIGKKLSHSYSAEIHGIYGSDYGLFELGEDEIRGFLGKKDFAFCNVTIPYKKTVAPFLDELSDAARETGSVNTIVNRGGRLCGFNTDIAGFEYMLSSAGICIDGKKAAVLGSGGTAETALYVCGKHGCDAVVVSRTGRVRYENTEQYSDADILINTTPVGMYPATEESPLDLSVFGNLSAVADVVYNPLRTKLALGAADAGITHVNGLAMLVKQAEESHRLAFGEYPSAECGDVIEKLKLRKGNVVLTGMPGCGKTSVGLALSGLTGRTFADTDAEFEKNTGITPAEFITRYGEAEFREKETETVRSLHTLAGCVIASGGGTLTVKENADMLRMNGTLVYIKRALADLPSEGRPLSKSLETLYAERKSGYERYADITVGNTGVYETAEKIKQTLLL